MMSPASEQRTTGPIEQWLLDNWTSNEDSRLIAFAREQDAIRADLLKAVEAFLALDEGRAFAHESWDDARAAVKKARGQ